MCVPWVLLMLLSTKEVANGGGRDLGARLTVDPIWRCCPE